MTLIGIRINSEILVSAEDRIKALVIKMASRKPPRPRVTFMNGTCYGPDGLPIPTPDWLFGKVDGE